MKLTLHDSLIMVLLSLKVTNSSHQCLFSLEHIALKASQIVHNYLKIMMDYKILTLNRQNKILKINSFFQYFKMSYFVKV